MDMCYEVNLVLPCLFGDTDWIESYVRTDPRLEITKTKNWGPIFRRFEISGSPYAVKEFRRNYEAYTVRK